MQLHRLQRQGASNCTSQVTSLHRRRPPHLLQASCSLALLAGGVEPGARRIAHLSGEIPVPTPLLSTQSPARGWQT